MSSSEEDKKIAEMRRIIDGPNYYYQGDFYEKDGGKHLGNALSLLKELLQFATTARTEGRAEQKEVDARVLEERDQQLLFIKGRPSYENNVKRRELKEAAAAIREQSEDKTSGETKPQNPPS